MANNEPIPQGQAPKTAREDWAHIAALFKAGPAMRPTRTWLNGMSSRLDYLRMEKLQNTKQAKALKTYLSGLSDKRIKTLRTFAAVNQEQTLAAFRVTLLGNVSVPILLVTFFNQVTQGSFTQFFKTMRAEDPTFFTVFMAGILGGVAVIALLAIFAVANLGQARDLRHLMDIHAAERGIYFGLEDMDDLNLS